MKIKLLLTLLIVMIFSACGFLFVKGVPIITRANQTIELYSPFMEKYENGNQSGYENKEPYLSYKLVLDQAKQNKFYVVFSFILSGILIIFLIPSLFIVWQTKPFCEWREEIITKEKLLKDQRRKKVKLQREKNLKIKQQKIEEELRRINGD